MNGKNTYGTRIVVSVLFYYFNYLAGNHVKSNQKWHTHTP